MLLIMNIKNKGTGERGVSTEKEESKKKRNNEHSVITVVGYPIFYLLAGQCITYIYMYICI